MKKIATIIATTTDATITALYNEVDNRIYYDADGDVFAPENGDDSNPCTLAEAVEIIADSYAGPLWEVEWAE